MLDCLTPSSHAVTTIHLGTDCADSVTALIASLSRAPRSAAPESHCWPIAKGTEILGGLRVIASANNI